MLTLDYDNFLMLDTDTYTQSSLDDLWQETEHNIMLYDILHRLSNPDCTGFNQEILTFDNIKKPITNYGGEFIAGNKKMLSDLIENAEKVFNKMKAKDFRTKYGDEFILRIVAEDMKNCIKNAGAYIYRYWTGCFYLCSYSHLFNPISILHVPDAKESGMIKVYNYIKRKNKLPDNKKAYRIFRFPRLPLRVWIANKIKSIRKKDK